MSKQTSKVKLCKDKHFIPANIKYLFIEMKGTFVIVIVDMCAVGIFLSEVVVRI